MRWGGAEAALYVRDRGPSFALGSLGREPQIDYGIRNVARHSEAARTPLA